MTALIIVGGFLGYNVIGAYVAGRTRSNDRDAGFKDDGDGWYAIPWLLWPLLLVALGGYCIFLFWRRLFKLPFELGDSYHKRKAIR